MLVSNVGCLLSRSGRDLLSDSLEPLQSGGSAILARREEAITESDDLNTVAILPVACTKFIRRLPAGVSKGAYLNAFICSLSAPLKQPRVPISAAHPM